MKTKNPFKKKEDLVVTSKTWTFFLDNDEPIQRGFMEKIIAQMKEERKAKGNNVDPEVIIKIKNEKK